MLSTNYSPTYIRNNIFVYDGAELDYVPRRGPEGRVYFLEQRLLQHLDHDVHARGTAGPAPSPRRVLEQRLLRGERQPLRQAAGRRGRRRPTRSSSGNPADYAPDAGVDEHPRRPPALFTLQDDLAAHRRRPLQRAHRHRRTSSAAHIYYGDGTDIGLAESRDRRRRSSRPGRHRPDRERGRRHARRTSRSASRSSPARTHPHNELRAQGREARRRRSGDALGGGGRRHLPPHDRHRLRCGHDASTRSTWRSSPTRAPTRASSPSRCSGGTPAPARG